MWFRFISRCLTVSDADRNEICGSPFPISSVKILVTTLEMSSSLPGRHTASQKCIFVNLKRKAGMLNMYIFVDIYVFRIWIFSCLHQLCGRIFFFLDVMLLKWNRFLIPQQTKGWFVLRFVLFFFSTWLFKLCLGFSSLPLVFENMQMNWMLECFCVLGQSQCIFFQRKCNMYSF